MVCDVGTERAASAVTVTNIFFSSVSPTSLIISRRGGAETIPCIYSLLPYYYGGEGLGMRGYTRLRDNLLTPSLTLLLSHLHL